MATPASYLPVQSDIRDPSHYVPELSRRSRAFAVWAIIKTLGREGISEMIIRHCHLAKRLAQQLSQVPGIEILNQVSLNQVIVGFGDDEQCGKMIESLARENRYLLGGATWHDRKVLRISIISWFIDEAEIDGLAEDIIRLWRELDA
jgi:glutamate/tyrosine decarboxylase-like PLP-dependent enzyme